MKEYHSIKLFQLINDQNLRIEIIFFVYWEDNDDEEEKKDSMNRSRNSRDEKQDYHINIYFDYLIRRRRRIRFCYSLFKVSRYFYRKRKIRMSISWRGLSRSIYILKKNDIEGKKKKNELALDEPDAIILVFIERSLEKQSSSLCLSVNGSSSTPGFVFSIAQVLFDYFQ